MPLPEKLSLPLIRRLLLVAFLLGTPVPGRATAPEPLAALPPVAVAETDHLLVDPDHRRIYAIARNRATSVLERDPATGTLTLAQVLDGADGIGWPAAISKDGRFIYSVISAPEPIYRILLVHEQVEGTLVRRAAVEATPLGWWLIWAPETLLVSDDGRMLYAANLSVFPGDGGGGTLALIPIDPSTRLPTFPEDDPAVVGGGGYMVPPDEAFEGIALSDDGRYIFSVSRPNNICPPSVCGLSDSRIAAWSRDPTTGMLTEAGRLLTTAFQPTALVYDGTELLVAANDPGLLRRFAFDEATATFTALEPLAVSGRPIDVIGSDHGRLLALTDADTGEVTVWQREADGLRRIGAAGPGAVAFAPGEGRVYLSDHEDDLLRPFARPCTVEDDTLCLRDEDRFRVEIDWQAFDGRRGRGQLVPSGASDRSGLFYFFRRDNWEMLTKVVDGCARNGHFWVFGAGTTNVAHTLRVTDTWAGTTAVYDNPLGSASPAITDTRALATCNAAPLPAPAAQPMTVAAPEPVAQTGTEPGRCDDTDTALCLVDGRFRVEVDWRAFDERTGQGTRVAIPSDDSGLFTFFSSDNWEMLVKVVDGCAANGFFWLFGAASTDVAYDLRVTDTFTGEQRRYSNPLGTASPAIIDTSAFGACP